MTQALKYISEERTFLEFIDENFMNEIDLHGNMIHEVYDQNVVKNVLRTGTYLIRGKRPSILNHLREQYMDSYLDYLRRTK